MLMKALMVSKSSTISTLPGVAVKPPLLPSGPIDAMMLSKLRQFIKLNTATSPSKTACSSTRVALRAAVVSRCAKSFASRIAASANWR